MSRVDVRQNQRADDIVHASDCCVVPQFAITSTNGYREYPNGSRFRRSIVASISGIRRQLHGAAAGGSRRGNSGRPTSVRRTPTGADHARMRSRLQCRHCDHRFRKVEPRGTRETQPAIAPRGLPFARAGAAPRRESASLRGISRRCGARCRCRPRAASRRWCRRTGRRRRLSRVDQLLDAVAHRFGRMRLAAVGRRRSTTVKKIFQLEDAAAGRHVFVGGDARDRRFVHADGVGDGLEIERPQVLHAVREETRPAGARSRSTP